MIVDLFGDDKMEQSKEDKALEAKSNEVYDMELTDEQKIDRKLLEVGIQEKYAKKYREAFPDKGIFYRGNLLKHFFLYVLDNVENATELQHVEQSFLTPSQVKLLNSKLQESGVMLVEEVKELENDLFGGSEGKAERIEKYTKDAIYTIHIVDGKELEVIYDTLTSCINCSKERLCCGATAACPVCDELMTNEEYASYVKKFAPQSEGKSGRASSVLEARKPNELSSADSKQTESEVETIETKIGSANLVEISTIQKRGKIVLINGYEGSGKTVTAGTFPNSFFICLEKGKFLDLIEYPPALIPEFADYKAGIDYIIANIEETKIIQKMIRDIIVKEKIKTGREDKQATYDNILKWVEWFKNQNEKKTLIIDTAKRLWDIAWGREAQKKGSIKNPKILGKNEYIPITTTLKAWVLDLIHWCRNNGRNLIFTSHTTGKYIDINQYDSIKTGEEPDAKYWIREAVSWRIDLLKPDQTLMEGKFIADFQKAPGRQYFKIDLTDKKLFEIINSRERLEEEIEIYKSIATPEKNEETGGLF